MLCICSCLCKLLQEFSENFLAEIFKIELNPSTFFLPEVTTEITGLRLPYKKCVSDSEVDVLLPFLVVILNQLIHMWL